MIHDILLSLLSPHIETLPIETFLDAKASRQHLHPAEWNMLSLIVRLAGQHRDVCRFVVQYSTRSHLTPDVVDCSLSISEYECLPKGLYLQAFCEGIDSVLLPFRESIADLERRYLQTPSHSLMFVYQHVMQFEPLIVFLRFLVHGVREQRVHGCTLLQYLHEQSLHGNTSISSAVKTIELFVHRVFLKQLTQWVMHGRFYDHYREFFIQLIELPSAGHQQQEQRASANTTLNNSQQSTGTGGGGEGGKSTGSGGHRSTTGRIANPDLWRYEIAYEQLPPYFSAQWAEKVRFIGQTVVTFNLDPNVDGSGAPAAEPDVLTSAPPTLADGSAILSPTLHAVREPMSTADAPVAEQRQRTLWNDQEHVYVQKLRSICMPDRLHMDRYETVVDDIKVYVSERLSETAIQQADLVRQLRLIKDFYLLGRGEFYLEFIRQTRAMLERRDDAKQTFSGIDETMARDITNAFTAAAHSINVVDDLEQFRLAVSLDASAANAAAGTAGSANSSIQLLSDEEQAAGAAAAVVGFIPSISLRYRVRWPLHLLFSPRIIDGYNEMFRFLLQIKRIQYQLQVVWCDHRERSVGRDTHVLQLRNKLMFVVNNLQYYLQVDVLEAQFSVLMQTVQESRDFEQIQRAHTVFQANVLSLCFLLGSGGSEANAASAAQQTHIGGVGGSVTMAAAMLNRSDAFASADNPVLIILNRIMQRVLMFCELSMTLTVPLDAAAVAALRHCDELFDGHVAELMRLLSGMRAGPSCAPLAQLLLRLDYNYWFSATEARRMAAGNAEDELDGDEEDEDAADED